jgi:adenylate kinase
MMRDDLPSFNMRVVLFELSDDTVVDRLSRRIMCVNTACQKVYSTAIQTPTKCTTCSGELTRRADDEPEVIRKRLAIYAQHKDEMLAEYRRYGVTIETFNVERIGLDDMFTQFSKLLNFQVSV